MGKMMGFKAHLFYRIGLHTKFDPEKFQCRNLKKKALSCSLKMKRGFQYVETTS